MSFIFFRAQTSQWSRPGEASWWSWEPWIRKLLQHSSGELLLLLPAQQPCSTTVHQTAWLPSAPFHHPFPLSSPAGRRGRARDQCRHRSSRLASLQSGSQNNHSLLIHRHFDDVPLREAGSCRRVGCWEHGKGVEWVSTADTQTSTVPLQDVELWLLHRCSQGELWGQGHSSRTEPMSWAAARGQD